LLSKAYIGVATPQANPTVEAELQRMVRSPVQAVFTRLVSDSDQSQQRLLDYIQQLPEALASFDTLPLRVFAFACTGSSYLVGAEQEEELVEAAERQHRVQTITATQAIRRELQGRGAHRIALLAPYPEELCDAAVDYWGSLGVEVVAVMRMEIGADTRAIYNIGDDEVQAALDAFDPADADLVLLSGTGMPTVATLQHTRRPVISSNLCLATEALRRAQSWPPGEAADIHKLLGETD